MPHLGAILVDGRRFSLYGFVPDSPSQSCQAKCSDEWPPLRFTIEGTLDSEPTLDESLVGAKPDPERHALGDRVAEFAGKVVHTFVGDTKAGVATGQGLHRFGGYWYVIAPSGAFVTKSP